MFLHLVKYNLKGEKGCYCSLMESYRDSSGKPAHRRVASLGFIPEGRVAFLKAAFSKEDPLEVLRSEGVLPREGEAVGGPCMKDGVNDNRTQNHQ